MTTKDNSPLLFKEKQDNVTDNGQYSNFTLNKNRKISSDAFSEFSKSGITERRKALDYGAKQIGRTAASTKLSDITNNSKTKKESHKWNKSTNNFSHKFAINGFEKEDGLKKGKALSGSTLSLHIEAYENSNDANLCNLTKEDFKNNGLIKKGLNAKQIHFDSTSVIQNPFEFSRQQENGEAKNPEIAQYRASQQLLNPNLPTRQARVQKPLPQNSAGSSRWGWLHRYPILNARFILRCFSIFTTFALIVILCVELFRPVEDLLGNSGTQKQAFGGIECEDYRGRLRLPSDMWNIYTKILSLCYSIWLFYKISVIFFPLFYGNWLYDQQERLYTYRTGITIVAGFNIFPLLFLGIFDCFYGRYIFCIAPTLIFIALLLDRVFIRANDYVFLFADKELLTESEWQGKLEYENPRAELLSNQRQPRNPSEQQSDLQPNQSQSDVQLSNVEPQQSSNVQS